MKIVGICRFSFLGRGDWKPYQGKPDAEIDDVIEQQATVLFADARMESRFATFEHLTLASFRAQSDQDFKLIVLASELMPESYKKKLKSLCGTVPQVELRFLSPMDVPTAQRLVFEELDLKYNEVLQFRLDDDDCVCVDFVALMRSHCGSQMKTGAIFVATVSGVMFSCVNDECAGVYYWPIEFLGAGVALCHPTKSVYQFGHFAMARRFENVVIHGHMSLVTHNGTNDTPFNKSFIEKRGMKLMGGKELKSAVTINFPFLTEIGKSVAGLEASSGAMPHAKEKKKKSAPQWLVDLAESSHPQGFAVYKESFALQHTFRGSKTLYVSFDNLSGPRSDSKIRSPWGYAFAATSGWSTLGVMTFRENWFREPELYKELEKLVSEDFFTKFERVVFSGTSMGGYGACAFSSLVPGSIVIAFSPQSTLNADLAGWDTRYRSGRKADWTGLYADAAAEVRSSLHTWIVFDPRQPMDRLHAERFAGSNVTLLRARRSGHFTAQFLSQMGILSELVRGCASSTMREAEFYTLYRRSRDYRRYLISIVDQIENRRESGQMIRLANILTNMNKPQLAKKVLQKIHAK